MEKSLFLKTFNKYQLGILPTEKPNQDTLGLSELAQNDLNKGLKVLKDVDVKAIEKLIHKSHEIDLLNQDIQSVLKAGGNIYLCGCGATGRLSLLLEFLWREKHGNDRVKAFMAGGDVALVHSLEGFEDFPELGARHLKQMGFTENDLLISCTEGGETPYVIGATEAATQISKWKPYFLYCNPKELLIEKIERSKNVLENSNINNIELFVGSMSLSGSTRMQASTVLQLAVGAALLENDRKAQEVFNEYLESLVSLDYLNLSGFIKEEEQTYKNGDYLIYEPKEFAITVFTDTTERSPTFSLPAFENDDYDGNAPSLCYILLPDANSKEEAWFYLLKRKPIPLNWPEIDEQTTNDYLEKFDFSRSSFGKRQIRISGKNQKRFHINYENSQLILKLGNIEGKFTIDSNSSLIKHSLVKVLLNTHSTLLMGRLDRYQSNIMTWVTPTNAKLVDRATRYILYLLKEKSINVEYLQVVEEVYNFSEKVNNESIVLKVYEHFLNKQSPIKEGHV